MSQRKFFHLELPARDGSQQTRDSDGSVDGWEAYHNWLTGVNTARRERAQTDRSIYTWKGYKSWSEKIRRDWDNES